MSDLPDAPSGDCMRGPRYCPLLSLRETELAVQVLKYEFMQALSKKLALLPVVAPRFVAVDSGLQDYLDGVMQPVTFFTRAFPERPVQVVHSLAKWKREALNTYGLSAREGVVTDMVAIRKDEELDPTHSLLVDQWDWEQKITPEDRTVDYLHCTVHKVYDALLETERILCERFPKLSPLLPSTITCVHSQDLADRWPELPPPLREQKAVEEYGAIFVRGIGSKLSDGVSHGVRSWDYDDFTTVGADGMKGLNGDIVVLDPTSGKALELSSMGIRVDADAMRQQAAILGVPFEHMESPFHQGVLNGSLPSCIGGGIGQSRVAMLFLRKIHIGEVQCSVWPKEMVNEYKEKGCTLL
ncbi:aspartate-ammonia ligase related protein [Cyclospora cayetanensis]|uniref:Aspartate-ammonia ligase related protein n=1 Tax=Cyclospora cayetanensis TaxID=88456 RepID=A0A1D3CZM8_9EIME|nr:aspartate-ammonia ligase related protein [Cyclospora cayetanensis]